MFEKEQLIQVGVFLGAAIVGVILLVAIPKSCSGGPSVDKPVATATAPAPGSVMNRTSQPKSQAAATRAAGVDAKSFTTSFGEYAAEAVKLSQSSDPEAIEKLDDLVSSWTQANTAEAAAWVLTLPAGNFREAAAAILCDTWAAKDPRAVGAWLTANLPNGQLQSGLGALVGKWTEKNPAAAAEWVADLDSPADKAAGQASLAQAWSQVDPAAAAAWLLKLPAEEQTGPLQNLLAGWSATDPSAAAAWLQSRIATNPQASPDGAAIVVSNWVEQDPGAVSKWLNNLPEGPLYETAVSTFSQSVAEKSPADALVWAKSLSNPQKREHAILFALEKSYEQDADKFLAGLPRQLEEFKEPALRKSVLDMLYRKDPHFRDSMLDLADNPAGSDEPSPTKTPAPSTPPAPAEKTGPSPVEEDKP